MPYVVRFDRPSVSTGPDAVVIDAVRYADGYREGRLESYRFFDADNREIAMVRAPGVVYIAQAGTVAEPEQAVPDAPQPPSDAEPAEAEIEAER